MELEQCQSMPMQLQAIQTNTTPPSSPRAQHHEEEFHFLSLNSSPTTPPLNDDDNDKAYPLSPSSSSPTDDCSTPSQDCASSYISLNLMNSQSSSSSSLSVLSPQSSQSATAAMEENIHRANEECAGLSKALSKFTKGSREYTMLKLKLDVAQDELACMKEDYDMFVNFASGVGDSGEGTMLHSSNNNNKNNNNNDRSTLLQLEGANNTVERSPKLVVSGIPTPPLHTNNPPFLVDKKLSHSCHGNFVSSSKEDGSNNTNNRQQQVVMDTKDLVMILESGVQKYSIEWFTIKSVMNQLSQMKEQSSISSSKIGMLEDATRKISNDFIREDVKNELLSRLRQSCQVPLQPQQQQQQQQQQQISTIVENKFNSNNEKGMETLTIGKDTTTKARRRRRQHKKERTSAKEECNLTTLRLDEVPKYSLEWFQIHKTLKGCSASILQ